MCRGLVPLLRAHSVHVTALHLHDQSNKIASCTNPIACNRMARADGQWAALGSESSARSAARAPAACRGGSILTPTAGMFQLTLAPGGSWLLAFAAVTTIAET